MKETSQDFIYGRNPVLEALEAGADIEKVLILQSLKGPYEKQIRHWAKEMNVPLARVPQEKLNTIVGNKAHQGAVAFISPITYHDLEEWLAEHDGPLKLAILDGITDVRNIGAIARSAKVFGIDAIVVSAKQAGRINADTVKTSAGAILQLDVIRVSTTIGALEVLQNAEVSIAATHLQASDYLDDTKLDGRQAVILGSEDKGIDRNLLPLCDTKIKIRQVGDFDSLNVSVAAGVVFYQWSIAQR